MLVTTLALLISLFAGAAITAPAALAADLGAGVLGLSKSVEGAEPREPGSSFIYTLSFACASTTTGCVDAVITDPIPEPFVIVGDPIVVGVGSYAASVDGRVVTVRFSDAVPNTTPASTGIAAGDTGTVQVQVQVPADLDKSWDGIVVPNSADIAATNAKTVTASAQVTLKVPTVLGALVTKDWAPESTQFLAGEISTVTLTGQNTSNIVASALTLLEPADPAAAGSVFNFYDLAGLGDVSFPAGADLVQVVATVGGIEHAGTAGVTAELPDTVDPAAVTALRFVFSSQAGATLSARGSAGTVKLTLAQRATNRTTGDSLAAGGHRVNSAGGSATTAEGNADAPLASDTQTISPLTVQVGVTKTFSPSDIAAGATTVAKISAANNSSGPLNSLTIAEPNPAGSFFTDSVLFGGFDPTASAWPRGATAGTVTWQVSSGATPAPSSFDAASGLPTTPTLTAGQRVTGFTVAYTGAIVAGAAASIGVTVKTTADAGPAGAGFRTYPNVVTVTGSNAAGTGDAQAQADLNVYFPEIKLTLDKTITPTIVVPGGRNLVQLSAQTPDGSSSVRPTSIVVTEPQNPTSEYWNAFDAVAIAPTSVPTGSILTIEYTTDGTLWHTVASVDATAAAKSYAAKLNDVLPNGTSNTDLRGLRFTFTDADGFGQATNVKPAIIFSARSTLRDSGAITNPGTNPDLTSYENCASSSATGTWSGSPAPLTSNLATDCAAVDIRAANSDPGIGALIADKIWDAPGVVAAQSQTTIGTNLIWGVEQTGMSRVEVTDPPNPLPVVQSVYQAFNLHSIDPITPGTDPLMKWDRVSKVELFDGTAWVDITAAACPATATCDGKFPGYPLSTAEKKSTLSVRLTFAEGSNRVGSTNPNAPSVGSGVASLAEGVYSGTSSTGRAIHLNFTVRDQVRDTSDGGKKWVTGDRAYNMRADDDAPISGSVDNTMSTRAFPESGPAITRSANDHVLIVDPAMTVNASKNVTPSSLVIPQPDVAASAYPTATYTTTVKNTSPTKTWQLRLSDPSDCTGAGDQSVCTFAGYDPATNPFEEVNLTGLAIGIPSTSGVQEELTVVSLLHRAADGTLSTTTATKAEAEALTAAQLADVVGVSVLFEGTNADGATGSGGSIAQNAEMTVVMQVKLRPTTRAGNIAPQPGTVTNRVVTRLHDQVIPGGEAEAEESQPLQLVNGNLTVETTKTIQPTSTLQANPVSPITVNLRARSTGTIAPKQLIIEDSSTTFWNAFTLSSFTLPTAPTGADQVRVEAQTGIGSSALWHGLSQAPTTFADAALPTGVVAAEVTGLRYTYTRADGAAFAASNDAVNVKLSVELRAQLRDGSGPVTSTRDAQPMPGETAAGTITNTEKATARYDDIVSTDDDTKTFTLAEGTAAIAVEKTTPSQSKGGAEIGFTLKFKNKGTGYLVNPVVVDTLPTDGSLLFVPTDVPVYATSANGTLSTDPTQITRSFDEATGVISFSWPAGARLAPGETFQITLKLQLKAGLGAGFVSTNTFGVSSDNILANGACTALNAGNGRPVGLADNVCTTSNIVTVLGQPSFSTSKKVKGASGGAVNVLNPSVVCTPDSDGFHRYPCAANSEIGQTDEWRLVLANGGTIAAKDLTLVDVFPRQGDTGVVETSPRGSGWAPTFGGSLGLITDGLSTGTGLDWYVTDAQDVCTDEITPGSGSGLGVGDCQPGDWVPSSEVDVSIPAADVTAVKLVFDFSGVAGGVLPPGGTVTVAYSSTNTPSTVDGDGRAPVTVPVAPVKAWNSFGYYASYVSGQPQSSAAEPVKAGVTMSSGPLAITKVITGESDEFAPAEFTASVVCTVAGAPVDMGQFGTVVLNTANSFTSRIDGIPTGASCAVTEDGADGSFGESSRSVTPASVVIASGVAADPVPSGQTVTITNDYAVTALTVTKRVDTPATLGSFGPFDFSLACRTSGGTALSLDAADAAFTLADGESHRVENLPVGSVCELTETDADGAASVPNNVSVTWGGQTTSGTSSSVTLAETAEENEAIVTNHFAGGTLAVTKSVDGDAGVEFGSGPFEVQISCTYQGEKIYDEQFDIRGGETRSPDEVFPAGSECSVVETIDGGANESTIDHPTVVIPGPVGGQTLGLVSVGVTNTFRAGTVELTKVRIGDGVDSYGVGPFVAQVSCTWQKDAETLTIPLPNGGVVELNAANDYSATLGGLIEGAQCAAIETTTGGATAVKVSPSSATVGADAPAKITITNTFDTASLVVDKVRIGAGVAEFGAGPFTVDVACTYLKDGKVTDIDLGENARFRLGEKNGWSKTIDNLIVGATCSVEEADRGLATASETDPADGRVTIVDDAAPASVTITNTFDVGHTTFVKKVDRAAARVGDTLVYTITATNDGQIDATGLTVTDVLPKGMKLVSSLPEGTLSDGALSWTIESLAVGATATFTVTAIVTAAGDTVNSATITTPPGPWAPPTVKNPCSENPDASCAVTKVTIVAPAAVLGNTGVDTRGALLLALFALLIGGLLAGTRVRRRRM